MPKDLPPRACTSLNQLQILTRSLNNGNASNPAPRLPPQAAIVISATLRDFLGRERARKLVVAGSHFRTPAKLKPPQRLDLSKPLPNPLISRTNHDHLLFNHIRDYRSAS